MVRADLSFSLRTKRLAAAMLAFALLLCSAAPSLAWRPPLPEEAWNEDAQIALARAMVGEADWNEPDHVAIAFVLARRWRKATSNRVEPLPFEQFVARYSASLRNGTARGSWIRGLQWGPMPGPFEQRWDRVRKLVDAWGRGRVKDPCPNAMHWGGAMDRPSRRYHAVSCGLTRNIFYAPRDEG
jgi:hypothetical protein